MQFDPFIIPFNLGLYFILGYVLVRGVIWFRELSRPDKLRLQRGFFGRPFAQSLKDIFMESLIHRRILKSNFRLGYMQIGEDFTPGLGFIPRRNIRNFYGGLGVGPRPKNSPVMQIKSGIKYAFISDLKDGGLLTSQMDFNISDIIFLSGDIISLSAQYQQELLTNDFHIFESFIIPADKYTFWRKSVSLTSAKRRNLWAGTKIGIGSFYSGKRTDWLLQAGYKIVVPVYVGMESDRKWVDLPDGSFVTQIYRLNLNFLFSPNLSWYNFAQYENQNETIGWQSRLQWIIKPGKEIFLTFNSPLIDPLERFKPEVYEARIKAKYTIRF